MEDKPAWLYQQSAVVPYLHEAGVLKIVLITSNSSGKWIVPKGVVEPDMTPEDSAAKEALEEAGVVGEVSDVVVAEYKYEKWGGTCHVQVFPLAVSEVHDSWDEAEQRERQIVNAADAVVLVKPSLKKVLRKFLRHYHKGLV